MHDHNIILIGDGGVGKTSLIHTLNTGMFDKRYCATIGAEVHPDEFNETCVNIWDVGGNNKYTTPREPYYAEADAAVIMYDVAHKTSYINVAKWLAEIRRAKPTIPIVLVANKCEGYRLIARSVACNTYNLPYFETSVKNRTNLTAPFYYLVTQLDM
jgi:GTP-binding nuclear protein Ran